MSTAYGRLVTRCRPVRKIRGRNESSADVHALRRRPVRGDTYAITFTCSYRMKQQISWVTAQALAMDALAITLQHARGYLDLRGGNLTLCHYM